MFCLWCARRCAFTDLRLETHQQIGACDDFPPLFDVFVLSEPESGPAQFVCTLLKALFDPGTHPIAIAQILFG